MTASKGRTRQKTKKKDPSAASEVSESKMARKPKELYDQFIFRDWCKSCGICSAFCPKNVIGIDENGGPFIQNPDDCIGCRFCEIHCPDFAITIKKRSPGKKSKSS